jgi:hypothetical protein
MGIFRNNVAGMSSGGGKSRVSPKRGRNGSGAYWPRGSPIRGNVFEPNSAVNPSATPVAPRLFGTPGNAGNNTQFGQNRVTTGEGAAHPNTGFKTISQQNHVRAMTINGYTGEFETPRSANPVIQPHERNSLPYRKVFGTHRTASGASRLMPSDTPFHPLPPLQRPKPPIKPQTYVLRVPRKEQVSFVSRNNLWVDPNNSFLHGQATLAGRGVGRWQTVKRGAAG